MAQSTRRTPVECELLSSRVKEGVLDTVLPQDGLMIAKLDFTFLFIHCVQPCCMRVGVKDDDEHSLSAEIRREKCTRTKLRSTRRPLALRKGATARSCNLNKAREGFLTVSVLVFSQSGSLCH